MRNRGIHLEIPARAASNEHSEQENREAGECPAAPKLRASLDKGNSAPPARNRIYGRRGFRGRRRRLYPARLRRWGALRFLDRSRGSLQTRLNTFRRGVGFRILAAPEGGTLQTVGAGPQGRLVECGLGILAKSLYLFKVPPLNLVKFPLQRSLEL